MCEKVLVNREYRYWLKVLLYQQNATKLKHQIKVGKPHNYVIITLDCDVLTG